MRRACCCAASRRNGLPYAMRLSLGIRESNRAFIDALEDILREDETSR